MQLQLFVRILSPLCEHIAPATPRDIAAARACKNITPLLCLEIMQPPEFIKTLPPSMNWLPLLCIEIMQLPEPIKTLPPSMNILPLLCLKILQLQLLVNVLPPSINILRVNLLFIPW
jgi:hypothetical protein